MGRVKEVESDLTKANTTAVLEVPGVPNIQDCFFPFLAISCRRLSCSGRSRSGNEWTSQKYEYAKNVIVATP